MCSEMSLVHSDILWSQWELKRNCGEIMRELAKVVEDVEEGSEVCFMSALGEKQTMQKGVKKLDAICARLQTLVHHNGKKEPSPPADTPERKEGRSHGEDNADISSRRKRKSSKPRSIHNFAVADDVGFDKDDISEYEINNRDVDFSPYINQNGDDLDDFLQESPSHPATTNGSSQAEQLDRHSPISVPAAEDNPPAQLVTKEPAAGSVGPRKQGGAPSEVDRSAEASVSKERAKKELGSSADASVLKGYAEDTMNELLSIYGLDNQAEAITKSVPLQNFSSRKILERSTPAQKSRVKQEFNNYQKFLESVAKLQELPKGSVIGNPPVLLPPGPENLPASATVTSSPQNKSPKSGGKKRDPSSVAPARSAKNKHMVTPESKKTPTGRHASPGESPGYTKYMKRFSSHHDCGGTHCQDMNYKDHYHCLDCSYRVFVKKEEMIRHYKWHKKRDDSLQHGFMRYSPLDDCTVKFGPCTHYGKQTHYHCLQSGCDKVYISTSDVQMHANYHRKASAIISEGFQRFRATEDCGTPSCQFYGQRTTHFHCRRSGCKFTFKNKADMEKHKSYHQKDEILSKDGFKKFMKYETCGFDICKYSKVSNHIHCIRPGCDYVLHSTGQLYAHKRKHERKDFELAYHGYSVPSTSQQYIQNNPEFVKLEDLAHMTSQDSTSTVSPGSHPSSLSTSPVPSGAVDSRHHLASLQNQVLNLTKSPLQSVTQTTPQTMSAEMPLDSSLNLSVPSQPQPQRQEDEGSSAGVDKPRDEMWREYLVRYTANDHCHSRCELLYKDHYHCQSEGCQQMFRSKEGVRDHARLHKFQDTITEYSYKSRGEDEDCDEIACRYNLKTKHYHCAVPNCSAVVTNSEPFDRLKHFKTHEIPTKYTRLPSRNTVADALKRKRGRPPKYQRDNIPVVPRPIVPATDVKKDHSLVFDGFQVYEPGELCPDALCIYHSRVRHWHCLQPRCHHATDRPDVLNIHKKDFHGFVHIREGFEFFDRNVNCRRSHCHNNKANRHFHCVRPKCDYSFVRHTTMQQHERRHVSSKDPAGVHLGAPLGAPGSAPPADAPPQMILIPVNEAVESVVKSAGTFFPQHLIGQPQTVGISAQPIQIIQTTAGPIAVTIPTIQTTQTDPPSVNAGLDQGVATTSSSKDVSQAMTAAADSLPLARLLKQTTQLSRQDWMMQLSKMHFSVLQNCGRPFCKLKKRNHYHCSECNQAFTEEVKLHSHIMNKHRPTTSDCSPAAVSVKQDTSEGPVTGDDSINSSVYEEEGSLDLSNVSDGVMDTSSVTPKTGRKRKRSWKFIETDPSKPRRVNSPRGEKGDTSVPPGYVRVRFDENCCEDKCSYRQLQTHYHCTRDDCKYGFSDRSRMLPHTLRHERIDKIMGSDFRQFRANLDCEHEACVFRQKSSHFHCLKCDFMCCDTNRVIGHRKHHSKMDGYLAQGFTKTAGTQDCEVAHCPHKTKQTHYHCIQPGCSYAVLTPSQMPPHKFRHDMEAKQDENGEATDQNVSL